MRLEKGVNGAVAADTDSGRSPSDDEKAIGHVAYKDHELPPDPDAHLSPEEKAAIVGRCYHPSLIPSSHGTESLKYLSPNFPTTILIF